jgi:hypothetical protein
VLTDWATQLCVMDFDMYIYVFPVFIFSLVVEKEAMHIALKKCPIVMSIFHERLSRKSIGTCMYYF